MNKPPATLEELERRLATMIRLVPPKIAKRLKPGLEVDPDVVTALEDWRIAALTPQALDQKTVQLMSFAIPLVQTSTRPQTMPGAAIKAGATLQELHASAAIAALFRGVAAFNLAGEISSTLLPEGAQGRASDVSASRKDKRSEFIGRGAGGSRRPLTALGCDQQRRRRLRPGRLDALAHHPRLCGDMVGQPSLERFGRHRGRARDSPARRRTPRSASS